jgi:4,5-dihydroxyphthalate decarboxylase
MAGIPLTLTCGDYEITRLLAEGAVTADGIDLTVLTDIASRDRHWRLARNGECDAGEFNAFGYFMAKERGHPFIALPVFPHRRFRHGFVFVNPTKGIRTPRDLIGRRIGVEGYQTAGCVWMKGILEEFFGVPHREITWVLPRPEDIPFTPPPGLRIEYAAGDKTDEEMLIGGEIDAVITPQVPAHFRRGDKRIARLFPNYKELEVDYFRRTGIFPIMHLVVISREIVDRHPWIPTNLARPFTSRRAWPTTASATRVSFRSRGSAMHGRNRSDSWAATPGPSGSPRRTATLLRRHCAMRASRA